MKLPKDYDETVGITGDYEVLEPGGYICKIVSAKIEENEHVGEMLVIAFDISEGDHEGIYKRRYDELCKQNKDPNTKIKYPNNGVHRLTVYDKEGKCNKFFKGFITSVEQSNSNYNFKESKADETTLKDKLFGGIFREEEYEKTTGGIGKTTKLYQIRSVQKIRDGEFNIPEAKKLQTTTNNIDDFMNVAVASDDDDLPF